jgi:hypothetical protein
MHVLSNCGRLQIRNLKIALMSRSTLMEHKDTLAHSVSKVLCVTGDVRIEPSSFQPDDVSYSNIFVSLAPGQIKFAVPSTDSCMTRNLDVYNYQVFR